VKKQLLQLFVLNNNNVTWCKQTTILKSPAHVCNAFAFWKWSSSLHCWA